MEGSARKLSNQPIFYALLKSDFHNIFHNLPGGLPALLDAFSAKVTHYPQACPRIAGTPIELSACDGANIWFLKGHEG